jgi:hypothetical protein
MALVGKPARSATVEALEESETSVFYEGEFNRVRRERMDIGRGSAGISSCRIGSA